ncbi:MAG: ROK family protein [Myxococcota bacterium]
MYFISIDIGGGSLKAIAGDRDGEVLHNSVKSLTRSITPGRLLRLIADAVGGFSEKMGEKPAGVTVGIPGLIDFSTGNVIRFPNLPNLEGYPLSANLEEELKVPFLIENDANLAAIGEGWRGSGRGVDNFLLVALGTGIGGGIVLRGELYRGENGLAGEIGHIKIAADGPKCGCGGRGCLETFAGGLAIEKRAEEAIGKRRLDAPKDRKADGAWLSAKARMGRNAAKAIYDQVGNALGRGIGSVIMTLDINTVIFAGGGAQALDLIKPPMVKEMERSFFGRDFSKLRIMKGELGEMAGRIGGIKLAAIHNQ